MTKRLRKVDTVASLLSLQLLCGNADLTSCCRGNSDSAVEFAKRCEHKRAGVVTATSSGPVNSVSRQERGHRPWQKIIAAKTIDSQAVRLILSRRGKSRMPG